MKKIRKVITSRFFIAAFRSLVHHFECGVWLYNVDAVQDMKIDLYEGIFFVALTINIS